MLTLVLVAALAAQSPPADATPRGSIAGRVIDAATGQPLADAEVRIASAEGRPSLRVTRTDDAGRFVFRDLPDGDYAIVARTRGYFVSSIQGSEQLPDGADRVYFVNDAVTVVQGGVPVLDDRDIARVALRSTRPERTVAFALTRGATIRGVVSDESGRPVPKVQVVARPVDSSGVRISYRPEERTDARGAYEITALRDGAYLVELALVADADGVLMPPQMLLVPGVPDARDATVFTVKAGDVISGADVVLRSTPRERVSGVIVPGPSGVTTGLQVVLESSPAGTRRTAGSGAQTAGVGRLDGDRYTFARVKPGRYVVWARVQIGEEFEAAWSTITFSGGESEVDLLLSPAGAASGRVVTDTGDPLPFDGLRVLAVLSDGATEVQFGAIDQAEVSEDGSFAIRGLFGDRIFQLTGLPAGWAVKRIVRNRRPLDPPHVHITPNLAIDDLRIVIGPR